VRRGAARGPTFFIVLGTLVFAGSMAHWKSIAASLNRATT
jgi:hypothetical protein